MKTPRLKSRTLASTRGALALLLLCCLAAPGIHAQSLRSVTIASPQPEAGAYGFVPQLRGVGTKLVSAGVGYAIRSGRLLWTNDNGVAWRDITPPEGIEDLQNLFFLDAEHGWIVFEDDSAGWENAPVHLLRTVDGGRTWSPVQFDRSSYAGLKTGTAFSGAPYFRDPSFFFVDAEHGWFLWRFITGSAFSFGLLLKTDDGGATWTELPDPPSGNGFWFHTPQDGWMTALGDGSELWATHDGGNTWQQHAVRPPADCSDCRSHYQLPEFQNPKDARMDVTFSDYAVEGRSVDCSYGTHDGGNSWQATRNCGRLTENPPVGVVVRVDTHTLRILSDKQHGLQIRSAIGTVNSAYPPGLPRGGEILEAQFADDLHGWVVYSTGTYDFPKSRSGTLSVDSLQAFLQGRPNGGETALLSTTNGGKSYRLITPPADPPSR